MKRGEVWWADLEPHVGSEASKVRPVVLVSRSSVNETASKVGHGVVSAVPLTSSVAKVYSVHVLVDEVGSGLSRPSKAQAEQVRSIDVGRLRRRSGQLSLQTMRAIDDALRLHLDL